MNELITYVTTSGACPIEQWFDSLDRQTAARITSVLDRMRRGNFGDHKGVGEGVSERRIDFGPGYRVYFGRDGDKLVILLGGGTKRRQQNDIDNAKACWREYKATKKEKR